MHTKIIGALSLVGSVALSAPAQANYTIRNLNNQYDQTITYKHPRQTRKTAKTTTVPFSITVPDRGDIRFTDIGDRKAFGCFAPTWGVIIRYQDQSWGYYYEGDGKIDVTIDRNGDLRLKPVNGKLFWLRRMHHRPTRAVVNIVGCAH